MARDDLLGRWAAVCHAVRAWAVAHPNEYALVYGTPVPGYTAPSATIAPAARVSTVLLGILADAAAAAERMAPARMDDDVAPDAHRALAPVRSLVRPRVPDALLQRGLMAWAALFGTVSFELFGQLHHVVGDEPSDRDAFFAECVRRWANQVGIAAEQIQALGSGPMAARERGERRRPPRSPGHPQVNTIDTAKEAEVMNPAFPHKPGHPAGAWTPSTSRCWSPR